MSSISSTVTFHWSFYFVPRFAIRFPNVPQKMIYQWLIIPWFFDDCCSGTVDIPYFTNTSSYQALLSYKESINRQGYQQYPPNTAEVGRCWMISGFTVFQSMYRRLERSVPMSIRQRNGVYMHGGTWPANVSVPLSIRRRNDHCRHGHGVDSWLVRHIINPGPASFIRWYNNNSE